MGKLRRRGTACNKERQIRQIDEAQDAMAKHLLKLIGRNAAHGIDQEIEWQTRQDFRPRHRYLAGSMPTAAKGPEPPLHIMRLHQSRSILTMGKK